VGKRRNSHNSKAHRIRTVGTRDARLFNGIRGLSLLVSERCLLSGSLRKKVNRQGNRSKNIRVHNATRMLNLRFITALIGISFRNVFYDQYAWIQKGMQIAACVKRYSVPKVD
jgi:hypothetical protein